MSVYLKQFETTAEYEAYIEGDDKILPNVSFTVDDNMVHYNKHELELPTLVCKYNVTEKDIVNDVLLYNSINYAYNFVSIEIDGNVVEGVPSTYRFETVGEHTVKFTLSSQGIGNNVFYTCVKLTSVIISSRVTAIGYTAFSLCNGLTSITINETIPPTLGVHVFFGTNDCPIYVPSESVEAYKAADGWSDYASRIQAIS